MMTKKTMQKVTAHQVHSFIRQFEDRYKQLPPSRVIALFYGVTQQTIYSRLNELEIDGKIKRLMKNKHATKYRLI